MTSQKVTDAEFELTKPVRFLGFVSGFQNQSWGFHMCCLRRGNRLFSDKLFNQTQLHDLLIKGVACFQVYISADLNFHLIPLKKKKNLTKKTE